MSAGGIKLLGNKIGVKQVSNPFRIFLVALSDSLNIFRMSKDNGTSRVQDIANGIQYLPMDSIQTSLQLFEQPFEQTVSVLSVGLKSDGAS